MPRPGPRVAVIQRNGGPAFVRDGHVYEGGGFGGEIVEAVRGVPEAENHAKTYKQELVGGFVASMAGVASMVGSVAMIGAAASAPENSSSRDTDEAAAGALLIGGLAAYIAGFVLILDAQPRLWDAINTYNDAIPIGPVPYGYAPPYPYPPGVWVPPAVPAGSAAPPPPKATPPSAPR
jgi:hypothetical protein